MHERVLRLLDLDLHLVGIHLAGEDLFFQSAAAAGAIVLQASSKGGIGYDWDGLEPVDVVFESLTGRPYDGGDHEVVKDV